MTKEELIGRKFIHKDDDSIVYTITDVKGNEVVLYWISSDGTVNKDYKRYTTQYALKTIAEGIWKLLPLETKMYKTSKGIEYGVGTQFTNTMKQVCIISKVENDEFFIDKPADKTKNHKVGSEKYMSNMFDKKSYNIIVNLMKDFKQVDPKTITFDFTNTKIKVNSPEESKWLYDCVIKNGYYRAGGRHPFHNNVVGLFFFSGKEFNTTINESAFRTHYSEKEITIQDILNSNQMNEVIEVGSLVEFKNKSLMSTQTRIVSKIDTKNNKVYFTSGGWDILSNMELSKLKVKEIIGYETVVDLPGIPKGTKSNNMTTLAPYGSCWFMETLYSNTQLSDTKFFKPIYKQDAIVVKFSKYIASLSKEHGLVFTDGESLDYKNVSLLVTQVLKPNTPKTKFGKYNVTFEAIITSIKVGCKSFTLDDVKVVEEAIKGLE